MIPVFRATMSKGIITHKDKQRFLDWWNSLSGEIEIIMRPFKENRTDRQNRFYWAYMRLIADETGDNENDLHEYFKRKHLPPRFATVMQKEIKLPASTTKLNTKEFSEYIKKIEVETGVPAPDINTIDYESHT